MTHDTAFEMAVSSIRFGKGVTREVGMDLADLGAKHVLVVTDRTLRSLPPVQTVIDSLDASKIRYTIYDRVRVEPTDESFLDAIAFARDGDYDAYRRGWRRIGDRHREGGQSLHDAIRPRIFSTT